MHGETVKINQSVIHSFLHSINSKNHFNESVNNLFNQSNSVTPLSQSIQFIYLLFIYSFIHSFIYSYLHIRVFREI